MAVLMAGCLAGMESTAGERQFSEYELKAAILPKLPLFVTWPDKAFADVRSPLRIGVLGTNPFGPYLHEAIRGKKIGSRQMVIHTCTNVEEAAHCHLVFITAGETNMADAVSTLTARGVLTVGDVPGFAESGGMVGLMAEDKRIGLRVNPESFQAAGLHADPQLLRIGRLTGPAGAAKK